MLGAEYSHSHALTLLLLFVPIALNGGRSADHDGAIAEVHYWKAKAGKLDENNRYIRSEW